MCEEAIETQWYPILFFFAFAFFLKERRAVTLSFRPIPFFLIWHYRKLRNSERTIGIHINSLRILSVESIIVPTIVISDKLFLRRRICLSVSKGFVLPLLFIVAIKGDHSPQLRRHLQQTFRKNWLFLQLRRAPGLITSSRFILDCST